MSTFRIKTMPECQCWNILHGWWTTCSPDLLKTKVVDSQEIETQTDVFLVTSVSHAWNICAILQFDSILNCCTFIHVSKKVFTIRNKLFLHFLNLDSLKRATTYEGTAWRLPFLNCRGDHLDLNFRFKKWKVEWRRKHKKDWTSDITGVESRSRP